MVSGAMLKLLGRKVFTFRNISNIKVRQLTMQTKFAGRVTSSKMNSVRLINLFASSHGVMIQTYSMPPRLLAMLVFLGTLKICWVLLCAFVEALQFVCPFSRRCRVADKHRTGLLSSLDTVSEAWS